MKVRRLYPMLALLIATTSLRAQDYVLHAYIDERLVAAPDDTSWTNGGFGKTRYGGNQTQLHFGGAAVYGAAQITPDLLAMGQVQYQTGDRGRVSLLEGWIRYRPVSTTPWRWSLRAGALFPPVSMENDGVGWTSPWTLSSSAINTWTGEELRAVGGEFELEHRGEVSNWDFRASLFRRDDPAGTVLAIRGWSIGDLVSGIGTRLREPDAEVSEEDETPPNYYDPFRSIGASHWGDYVAVSWHAPGETSVSVMHYDNHADPGASAPYAGGDEQYAWRTRFWSAGARTDTGAITWIAQALDGYTTIEPVEDAYQRTHYRSAFLLAGWNRGAWRPALRIEHFSTLTPSSDVDWSQSEHGNAVTGALNWRPRSYLRLTAEVLRIDSTSTLRAEYGLPARIIDTQLQLSVRLLY
ncbi:porin family protein [Rhodanobacter hydrolyticus]|uniref:Porin n=1 Tax=Rhodanobacter hydrolyticus TaxID=2250595 RepID=A0ABW8J8J9_9GAMM